MAVKKHFVNPLTRSSEVELHVSAPQTSISQPEDVAVDSASANNLEPPKARGEKFESTHQRVTFWIDKKLKIQFDELLAKRGGTKTQLLNEAVTLLLYKHTRKSYTKHANRGK